MNEVMKPRFSKLCRFPIPAELIAVVGGTTFSHIFRFGELYKVHLVGNIPMGLPMPELPPPQLLWLVAVDSIAISIVSYTVTISMAMIFAKKHSYEVRPNQELLAMVIQLINYVFLRGMFINLCGLYRESATLWAACFPVSQIVRPCLVQ